MVNFPKSNKTTEEDAEINKSFNVNELPSIELNEYLTRMNYFLDMEISTFLISIIYIERIRNSGISLNEYNKYKLILTAISLAIKSNEDDIPGFGYLAKVGGIKPEELKKLELSFLEKIEFKLFVNENELEKFYLDMCL